MRPTRADKDLIPVMIFDVTVTFENTKFTALKNIDLHGEDRETVAVLGPSGSGKTTLLRVLAGLEFPTEGEVYIKGKEMTYESSNYRNVAMMNQNCPLFPSMTAYENIMFTPKLRRKADYEIDERLKRIVELLGLESLLDRKPSALSGGEKQRVALARAMMRDADYYLFDEPLSNLDPMTAKNIREAFTALRRNVKGPFFYVTHDQSEAMSIADRVLVLNEGVIQQDDKPDDLYKCPSNKFVASFVGSPQINFLPAVVVRQEGRFALDVGGNMLELSHDKFPDAVLSAYQGKELIMGIRPQGISPFGLPEEVPACGQIKAVVASTETTGFENWYHLKVGGAAVIAAGTRNRPLRCGEEVLLTIAQEDVHLFDQETHRNILCPPKAGGDE